MNPPYRPDYPRPQFMRQPWINLNGEWEFAFDDDAIGEQEQWYKGDHALPLRIQVPFAFQSKLSGIHDPQFHDLIWYRRSFEIPASFQGKRVILHFGAVDYQASVWINGVLVAAHEGGHTPFQADITHALQDEHNILVVKVVDFSQDLTLPRGKQYWLADSASIFYTRTTGIWQTVWMEAVEDLHLAKVKMTPDIDRNEIQLQSVVRGITQEFALEQSVQLKVRITLRDELVCEDTYSVNKPTESRSIKLHDQYDHSTNRWWSPAHPNLYDITFTLMQDSRVIDEVTSYFGMRKISIENGNLCLNNRPFYSKMVLDQGYFPDGNLTPPSDEALRRDVELTKEMGFNGVRKHQKLEDPRYLYWCDQLGLVVWSEAANAFDFSDTYVERFTREWIESMDRDYNHPCIIAWVPLNESWGVPNIQIDPLQQQHALAMYHLTKSLDPMRLVISNDGWELVQTDLATIHDYEWQREVLEARYSKMENIKAFLPADRRWFVGGYAYEEQPILVTEFGGIAYKKGEWDGWGYSGAEDDTDYESKLRAVTHAILQSPIVQGYCYTQLTDVEQEINGLLTYDRQLKLPVEVIRSINEGR